MQESCSASAMRSKRRLFCARSSTRARPATSFVSTKTPRTTPSCTSGVNEVSVKVWAPPGVDCSVSRSCFSPPRACMKRGSRAGRASWGKQSWNGRPSSAEGSMRRPSQKAWLPKRQRRSRSKCASCHGKRSAIERASAACSCNRSIVGAGGLFCGLGRGGRGRFKGGHGERCFLSVALPCAALHTSQRPEMGRRVRRQPYQQPVAAVRLALRPASNVLKFFRPFRAN